jgi:Na+/melibiose symporter-like transporter
MGLPLAFAALPLYVLLPQHYAQRYGMPLATLGALLLAVRAVDALWDPLVGRWVDAAFARGRRTALATIGGAAAALLAGFAAVFFPPAALAGDTAALLAWCGTALAITCLAYCVASVLHQAWAARLGGSDLVQTRRVAGREGAALAGVLLASVLPSIAGWPATVGVLAVALAAGWAGLAAMAAAPAANAPRADPAASDVWSPWRSSPFRRLLAVYLLNGIANAIPATLLLFLVSDVLQAPSWTAPLLASYFAAGATSLPLWVRAVARWGLERAWGASMLLAVAAFCLAALLGAGDARWFLLVCLASGLTLGADLAVPTALLARVVGRGGQSHAAEGVFFGWWNGAAKLSLALAAGLALPLLHFAGYAPGARDPGALTALSLAYALLPCALKLLALGVLATFHRATSQPTRTDPR